MSERFKLTMLYTLFTGVCIVIFGVLNLTFLLNFISRPVLSGFVSASAIIAAASTVKSLLGISVQKSPIVYILFSRIWEKLPNTQLTTAVLSMVGILLMYGLPMCQRRTLKRIEGKEGCLLKPIRFLSRVPVVLYIVFAGVLFGARLCNFAVFTRWQPEHVVVGRGATSVSSLQDSVGSLFNCSQYKKKVVTTYKSSGSGDGLASVFGSQNADFACSDKKPSPSNLLKYSVQMFPFTEQIICPVANVPLLHDTNQISLVLNMEVVSDIYFGKIVLWNDVRIRELNPNLPWKLVNASQQIHVVARSDSSGTTRTFAEEISKCSNCSTPSGFVADLDAKFTSPHLIRAEGNSGVVKTVSMTHWSIGYATLGEVRRAQTLQNADVHCVSLRSPSRKLLTVDGAWKWQGDWPINHQSFILVPNVTANIPGILRTTPCENRKALYEYLMELFSHPEVAAEAHMKLLPRPNLETILCEAKAPLRRLAAGKCKAATAKCGEMKMVGFIETALPRPQIPSPSTAVPVATLFLNALLLASVALLEHVANVKLYADKNDYSVVLSTDLIAVGLSNIFGSLFGSFISAGGFSRSALNKDAKSQLSGLLSVFISFGVVLVASPVLSLLPHAVLNVILFVAVASLIDYKLLLELVRLRRRGIQDLLALVTAFAATCFLGVVQGMMIAIGFSLVMFIFNSTYPEITELERVSGSNHYEPCASDGALKPVKILRFEAAMWFANITRLSDALLIEFRRKELRGVILDMSAVPRVDTTAAAGLKKLLMRAKEQNVTIAFAATQPEVREMIRASCEVEDHSFMASVWLAEMIMEDVHDHSESMSESCDIETGKSNKNNSLSI